MDLKHNEVLYFEVKNPEKFKLENNKEIKRLFKEQNSFQIKKIRILSNQILKINIDKIINLKDNKTLPNLDTLNNFENNINNENNYNDNNSYNNTNNCNNKREINFFGLLLRVSKDFLTPSYNLIIQINGGGCFTQSSESHLIYLKK